MLLNITFSALKLFCKRLCFMRMPWNYICSLVPLIYAAFVQFSNILNDIIIINISQIIINNLHAKEPEMSCFFLNNIVINNNVIINKKAFQ